MKNLKIKATLVVLLVIMLTSTCFAANSFSNIDGTKYELPVKALCELEIITKPYSSDSDYSIDKEVTRAEMIKGLIQASGMEVLAGTMRNEKVFNDVPSNYWASGYINLAYSRRFLIEDAGTDFRPDEAVTYSEAVTYCMRVLGYGYIVDNKGTWPTNYIQKAQELKLLAKIAYYSYDEALNRGNFAILLWNTMNTDMYLITSSEYQSSGKITLLETNYPEKLEAIMDIQKVKKLEFEEPIMNLSWGSRGWLKLLITPSYATEKVTYSSSNENYVTVNDKGRIEAKEAGRIATITAKSESGATATCKVVVPKKRVEKMILGFSVNKDGINSDDIWESSNESVVAFEGEKYVAKKIGKATLTAYLKDNPDIKTCVVEVEVVETLGSRNVNIIDNKKSYSLKKGETLELKAEAISTIESDTGSEMKISWASSDTSVATVESNDKSAKIIAKGIGTCTITAQFEGATNTCTINVIPAEVLPTNLKLSKSNCTLCLADNSKFVIQTIINPTIEPEDASNKTITWSSSDTSIASIVDNKYITTKAKGNCVITGKTINGVTATCDLKVVDHTCFTTVEYDENNHWEVETCSICLEDVEKKNVESHAFVNGVCKCGKTFSKVFAEALEFEDDIMNLELGRSKKLNLKITPNTANEKITYTSSNKNYVTVNNSGTVKAIMAGRIVTITAKSESGKTATCKVVVPQGGTTKVPLGGYATNNIGLNSDDIWVSSDESIVALEDEGYVGKKLGKSILTAYLKDNPNIVTAKIEVEVVEKMGSMSIEVKGEKSYTLKIGDKVNLEAEIVSTVESDDGSKHKLVWESSNQKIVKVNGNDRKAKLTAVGEGKCDVVITCMGMRTVVEVEVIDPNAIKYDDVNENDWFKESVKYVTNNKLMNGMGENKFNPTSNMTRGMIVTVLYRMSGSTYNGKSTFADVKESEYYSLAVAWAANNNIVNGIGENKFAPNTEITREQLIVILYRYVKAMKIDVNAGENTNILSYDDFNEIAEYSITAFQWGCGKGIISGRTSTTLSPKGTASRAEVATMLMRFAEN